MLKAMIDIVQDAMYYLKKMPCTTKKKIHSIAFHSVATTTNKLMAWPWVLKWDPATPIFF